MAFSNDAKKNGDKFWRGGDNVGVRLVAAPGRGHDGAPAGAGHRGCGHLRSPVLRSAGIVEAVGPNVTSTSSAASSASVVFD